MDVSTLEGKLQYLLTYQCTLAVCHIVLAISPTDTHTLANKTVATIISDLAMKKLEEMGVILGDFLKNLKDVD